MAKRAVKLGGDGGRRGMFRRACGERGKLRRGVQRGTQVREGAGPVRPRAGGTVRMAMLPTARLWLGAVDVRESESEGIQRIARRRAPGFRDRRGLRFVLVRLAPVLLAVEQRRDHEAEHRHRGEKQCTV